MTDGVHTPRPQEPPDGANIPQPQDPPDRVGIPHEPPSSAGPKTPAATRAPHTPEPPGSPGIPPEPPAGPTTGRSDRRAQWPLRVKIPGIIALLLLIGLGTASVGGVLVLRSFLLSQVDDQLARAMASVTGMASPTTVNGPSNYALLFFDADGQCLQAASPFGHSLIDCGASDLPNLAGLEPAAASAWDGRPFTVHSVAGSASWRVMTETVYYRMNGQAGTVAVGLPLDQVSRTTAGMAIVLAGATAVLTAIGTAAGFGMVRRSLRPLRDVEATAAAIAGGDLSRRAPGADPATEVGSLTTSLNTMLSQIEAAFDARSASERRMRQFVADASHELRTPLAAIRGYGELYRMGAIEDPAELAGAMRRIENEAARMGILVTDLLHLTRLDEGRGLRREDVDLLVLAADGAADLRAIDPTRTVTVISSAGPTRVIGDETQLRQVLANLIGNVSRHTRAGSPVEIVVRTWREPDGQDWAGLGVVDHGLGIPQAQAARVFERFYRLDASRSRDSGGSGLGLAIVAAVAEAHGGSVHLSSTAGGGATFEVRLPLTTHDGGSD